MSRVPFRRHRNHSPLPFKINSGGKTFRLWILRPFSSLLFLRDRLYWCDLLGCIVSLGYSSLWSSLCSGKRSKICWAIGCRIIYSLQIPSSVCCFILLTYYITAGVPSPFCFYLCLWVLFALEQIINYLCFPSSFKFQIRMVVGPFLIFFCFPSPSVRKQKITWNAHSFALLWWMDSHVSLEFWWRTCSPLFTLLALPVFLLHYY